MKRALHLFAAAALLLMFGGFDSSDCRAAEFYVAPDGTADGDGSRQRPWNLATALNHPPAVRPGDTLWLAGGTYSGNFRSRLQGTAERPIIVRQARGERAVLDAAGSGSSGTTLAVHGAHTWFWGFEISNSTPQRVTAAGGSHPSDLNRAGGVDVYEGPGHKLINLVVHDCSGGISAWSGADDTEAYGNLVFNNGWDAPDRGHGHAFYWQNRTGTKRIVDNVFFHQFSHGIHAYGSSRAFLNNFHVEGNIAFDNGMLSKTSGPTRNVLIGGGRVAENLTVVGNVSYYSQGGGNIVGYGRGARGLELRDNQFLSPKGQALQLSASGDVTVSGNTFWGAVQGIDRDQFGDNAFVAGDERALGVQVVVRPNRYEPGRAHIAVVNAERRGEVDIDLSEAGLKTGDDYELRDVLDYFGAPIAKGTWNGGPLTVSLPDRRPAPPIGRAPVVPKHTAPEFAVFVLGKPASEPE